jgi:hypothetical protein
MKSSGESTNAVVPSAQGLRSARRKRPSGLRSLFARHRAFALHLCVVRNSVLRADRSTSAERASPEHDRRHRRRTGDGRCARLAARAELAIANAGSADDDKSPPARCVRRPQPILNTVAKGLERPTQSLPLRGRAREYSCGFSRGALARTLRRRTGTRSTRPFATPTSKQADIFCCAHSKRFPPSRSGNLLHAERASDLSTCAAARTLKGRAVRTAHVRRPR